jgi:hypothetical protein
LYVLLFELKEWLPDKAAGDVIDGCSYTAFAFEFVDFFKGLIDRISVCHVGLDAHSLASGLVDFGDERLVVGRCTSEESHRVFFGEAAGD